MTSINNGRLRIASTLPSADRGPRMTRIGPESRCERSFRLVSGGTGVTERA